MQAVLKTINFKRSRNFSQKIDATFEFVRQNYKPIARNILLTSGPFVVLGTLLMSYASVSASRTLDTTGPFPMPMPNIGMMLSSAFSFFALLIIATTLVVAIVLKHIERYIETESAEISAGEIWRIIWPDFFKVLGNSIGIYLLIFFSAMILFIPIFFFVGVLGAFGGAVVGVIGLLAAGFAAILVISASLLIFPVSKFEKINFFDAIGRVMYLIRDKWLSTAGLVFIMNMIILVIAFVILIPYMIVMYLYSMHMLEGGQMMFEGPPVLLQVIGGITSLVYYLGFLLLYTMVYVAITFQYFNLVELKEARGLIERMNSFGVNKEVTDEEEHY